MKKNLAILVVLGLFLVSNSTLAAQVNLTGTWEGPTYAEGAGIDLVFTLVLEHKGSTITGKLSDDMGYISCDITEVNLEKDVLTFQAVANTPDGDIPMTFKMNVMEGKLEGKWEAGDAVYGEWTAEKK